SNENKLAGLQRKVDRSDLVDGIRELVGVAEFDVAHFDALEALRWDNRAPLFHDERGMQRLLEPIDAIRRGIGVEQYWNRLHEPETGSDHEQQRRRRFRNRCTAERI